MLKYIECKLRSKDIKEVDNTVVAVAIKDEVKVAELVEVMDRLSAITAARQVILQDIVRILQRHVSITNNLIM